MLLVVICVLELCVFATCLLADVTSGYYWRDYSGTIPEDALIGEFELCGRPVYIAQILHGNNLLTAKLSWIDRRVFYTHDGLEHSSTRNVKVLCTLNPERFEWIDTTHDKMHLLTCHNILNGGFERGRTLYIGRAFHNQEAWIGRIVTTKAPNLGLHIPFKGKEISIKDFEVLTYNNASGRSKRMSCII